MIDISKALPTIESNQANLDEIINDLILDIYSVGPEAAVVLLAEGFERFDPQYKGAKMIAITALYRLATEKMERVSGS